MCRGTGGTDDYARARIRAVAVRRRRFTAGMVINDLFMAGDIRPACKNVNAIKASDPGLRSRLAIKVCDQLWRSWFCRLDGIVEGTPEIDSPPLRTR
jgi:hypothetical protein